MRHQITIACLLAAILFYSQGSLAAPAFLVLGMIFEGAFWMRIVRRNHLK